DFKATVHGLVGSTIETSPILVSHIPSRVLFAPSSPPNVADSYPVPQQSDPTPFRPRQNIHRGYHQTHNLIASQKCYRDEATASTSEDEQARSNRSRNMIGDSVDNFYRSSMTEQDSTGCRLMSVPVLSWLLIARRTAEACQGRPPPSAGAAGRLPG
ncbi:hypothetical protein PHISCL_10428, partial [Aspergillus sclerotialis]